MKPFKYIVYSTMMDATDIRILVIDFNTKSFIGTSIQYNNIEHFLTVSIYDTANYYTFECGQYYHINVLNDGEIVTSEHTIIHYQTFDIRELKQYIMMVEI